MVRRNSQVTGRAWVMNPSLRTGMGLGVVSGTVVANTAYLCVLKAMPVTAMEDYKTNIPRKSRLRLMKQLVDLFSHEGQTILDPFMGSGSTGVACLQTGRRFIGVELDSRYFDAACCRIEEAQRQPDMFIDLKAAAHG